MRELFQAFDGFAPAVTVLFPAAVLVGAISVVLRSHLWRTVSTPHDPLIDALLVYSAMAAAYLVLTPQPGIEGKVQLFPGDDLWTALRAAPGDAQPWVQLAGNVLLLLPLGALIPLRLRWFDSLGKIIMGGLIVTISIEVIQVLFVSGRVASADDVVLNTIGAGIGGLLVRGPWWQAEPAGSRAPARVPGPQHSVGDASTQTVWRIIEKIEEERSDRPTIEIPAVRPRESSSEEYPALGKRLREPARQP